MVHLNDLRHLDGDAVLGALGLQRRRSAAWVAPAVGALAVGAAMGAGVALLVTPLTGEKLRTRLRERLAEARRARLAQAHQPNEEHELNRFGEEYPTDDA